MQGHVLSTDNKQMNPSKEGVSEDVKDGGEGAIAERGMRWKAERWTTESRMAKEGRWEWSATGGGGGGGGGTEAYSKP